MKKFRHKIAHLFGLNHGVVESFWIGDIWWIGFRCTTCSKLEAYPSHTQMRAEENYKKNIANKLRNWD